MSEELNKTKTNILDELESIKGLLLLDEQDIPVLEEPVDDHLTMDSAPLIDDIFTAPDTTELNFNVEPTSADVSIEIEEDFTGSSAQQAHTQSVNEGTEENPFLPKHIRSRLRGNRSPDASQHPTEESGTDIANLLVASIMPQLERLLRQRLSRLTKAQINTLLKTNK